MTSTPRTDPLQGVPTHRVPVVVDPAPSPVGRIRLAGFVLFTALGADAWQSLLGWPAFIVLVVGLSVASGVVLVRTTRGRAVPWIRYSKPLAAFLVLCAVSIVWSQYTGATALGATAQLVTAVAGVFIAVTLSWLEILRALGTALRWLLGLSIVFELFVAVFVGHPVGAIWLISGGQGVPPDFQWSTSSLLGAAPSRASWATAICSPSSCCSP
ncbi:hypothetical protein [Subtercola boreus]|uniref:hypothetical protein n=1 Tax=Subtercola boreus TaxID=120213 RepID=UPI001559CDE9|nr:hypothetical protein [Subtercola boreus]